MGTITITSSLVFFLFFAFFFFVFFWRFAPEDPDGEKKWITVHGIREFRSVEAEVKFLTGKVGQGTPNSEIGKRRSLEF